MLCTENSTSRWGIVITFLKGYTYHSNTGFTRLYKHLLKQNEILHWYHWQELPQVSFLSRQKFCCDKSFVTTKICLPQQNFCPDKIMFCHDKIFLSWQTQKLCHDKHTFVVTKDEFCHDKHVYCYKRISVVTKFRLRQNYVCRDKTFVTTKYVFCHDKHMFVTIKLLLQQKWYLWQLLPMIHLFINKIDSNTVNMKNWQRLKCSIHGCSRPVDHDVSLFALSPLC